MNELIQRLIDKTGLSEDQATTAVNTVVQFLKEKLPAPLASQLDNFMDGSGNPGMADKLSSVGASLGGLFGKKD
ncbi:MAG: hypothetical protein ACXU8A_08235 [Burkholderiaceae bacterium]